MKHINSFLPIIVVIALCYWAIAPLFHPGFFPMHDDAQIQRVFEMKTALQDGMFPVRWVPDLGFGYGYPIFTFYAPLAYYIGGFFNLIGFDALIATKVMIGLGMLVAGISMYVLAREFWGKSGAIVSSLLYVYAPYHAVNLYVRGAISELWAYGLIPFVFFGIYKIYKNIAVKHHVKFSIKQNWLWICFTAVSYGAVIVAHNLTAMMVTPFLFIEALYLFLILPKKNYRAGMTLFISLVIGITLAAFCWLPAITEMMYTNVNSIIGGGSDYKDHFVCLSQLWNSPWGYGGSAPGCLLDGLSFRLGKVHIILVVLSLIPLAFTWKGNKNIFFTILLSILGALVSLFFLLEYSKYIWDHIPQMAYFQFPWRFLVLASFFSSFLGGSILILLPRIHRFALVIVIVVAIFVVNAKLFIPEKTVNFTTDHYTNKSFLNWETSKISYEYMPKAFSIPKEKQDMPKEKITFTDPTTKLVSINAKTQTLSAVIKTSHPTNINVAIAYFPAWQMFLDKHAIPYTQFDKGLKIKIPAGTHMIQAVYKQTPIELVADSISLTGVLILLIGIIALRKENIEKAI